MTQHYRLAQTSITVVALLASVSLGFWAGFAAAPLRPAGVSAPKAERS